MTTRARNTKPASPFADTRYSPSGEAKSEAPATPASNLRPQPAIELVKAERPSDAKASAAAPAFDEKESSALSGFARAAYVGVKAYMSAKHDATPSSKPQDLIAGVRAALRELYNQPKAVAALEHALMHRFSVPETRAKAGLDAVAGAVSFDSNARAAALVDAAYAAGGDEGAALAEAGVTGYMTGGLFKAIAAVGHAAVKLDSLESDPSRPASKLGHAVTHRLAAVANSKAMGRVARTAAQAPGLPDKENLALVTASGKRLWESLRDKRADNAHKVVAVIEYAAQIARALWTEPKAA